MTEPDSNPSEPANSNFASVPTPDVWLDERGARCPAPVIALARAAFTRPAGTVVAVLAIDPAAGTDIPAWCRLKGAEYLGELPPRDGGEGMAYVVRTGVAD